MLRVLWGFRGSPPVCESSTLTLGHMAWGIWKLGHSASTWHTAVQIVADNACKVLEPVWCAASPKCELFPLNPKCLLLFFFFNSHESPYCSQSMLSKTCQVPGLPAVLSTEIASSTQVPQALACRRGICYGHIRPSLGSPSCRVLLGSLCPSAQGQKCFPSQRVPDLQTCSWLLQPRISNPDF